MLTLSEISIRIRDYFTLKGNDITCDYCGDSYDIIIYNEDVRKHLMETHEEYANAVSSESKQEDLKKFYTIHNNNIKCYHDKCDKLYISWNSHSIIKYHLGHGHETDEFKVEGMRRWIREKYQLNESDGKQYCNNCQEGIKNKPIELIRHLADKHDDVSHLIYKPTFVRKQNKLDKLFEKRIWNYFIRKGEYAQCSLCIASFKYLQRNWYHMKEHMRKEHVGIPYVPLSRTEYPSMCKISLIQQDLVNCDRCNTIIETKNFIHSNVQNHLEDKHSNNNFTETWRNWVFEKIDKLPGFQKSYCKYCNTKLEKMCPSSLRTHLKDIHDMEMSSGIGSMGESSSLGSMHLFSYINVENIPTLSGHQQPGSSKSSGIEVRDVDCDRDNTMGNLKRKLSSLSSSDKNVTDIATVSTVPQAGSSKDLDTDDRDGGMNKVKNDDDTRPPDEFCAPSSVNTPVDINQFIAAVGYDQESTSSSSIFHGLTNPDDPDNDLASLTMNITPTDN